ncbi:MAG TPA: peptide-methionine (S)-S-oxide reductase MsrA [Bacteroidota bacterium]
MTSTRLLMRFLFAVMMVLVTSTAFSQKGKEMAQLEKATFGAGCFWCVEAVFERLGGVKSVVAGYAGGTKANPTYEEVCTGNTGHAEVAQITYDPAVIKFETLLEWLWKSHDPTTLNRQGADAGTQYRSVIFYHDDAQKTVAEKSKTAAQAMFKDPIVTEIQPLTKFYEAENYHQDYYKNNQNAPYCTFVIKPKLKKLKLDKVDSQ